MFTYIFKNNIRKVEEATHHQHATVRVMLVFYICIATTSTIKDATERLRFSEVE